MKLKFIPLPLLALLCSCAFAQIPPVGPASPVTVSSGGKLNSNYIGGAGFIGQAGQTYDFRLSTVFLPTSGGGGGGVSSIAGTSGQITASASTGNVTLSFPTTLIAPGSFTATGKIFGTTTSNLAGINVGSFAGNPASPINGDLWYNSTANALDAYINGVIVALGSGGGGGGVSSIAGTSGQITASSSTGAVTLSLPATITQAENFSGPPSPLEVLTGATDGIFVVVPSGLSSPGIMIEGQTSASGYGLEIQGPSPSSGFWGMELNAGTGSGDENTDWRSATGTRFGEVRGDGLFNWRGNLTLSGFTTNGHLQVTGGGGVVSVDTSTSVTSIAGTLNEITASASTGAVTLSFPSAIVLPGTLASSGVNAATGAIILPASPLGALAIDVTKSNNQKLISGTNTFTFSGTPAITQTFFGLQIINSSGTPFTQTIPSSWSEVQGTAITSVIVPANGEVNLEWQYDASNTYGGSHYIIRGDPTPTTGTLGNYVLSASPTITGTLTVPTIDSPTGTALVLGTTSFGNALIIASATGNADFLANIAVSGNVAPNTDNTYTLGLSGADRWSNVFAVTFTGALSGNATTATTLATARAINGVNFDGSAPITVTAAAGTLTGSTLASGVTASSLTSVGTLSTLTSNSVKSQSGNDLTIGTGTTGTAVTFASATNIATFAAPVVTTTTSTRAAINLGSLGGNPSSPSNGDVWYNTSTNTIEAYINGSVTPWGTSSGSVASVSGTSGQIVTSPTTGAVIVSLANPITTSTLVFNPVGGYDEFEAQTGQPGLGVVGADGQPALYVVAQADAGVSKGLKVFGGTNSSDYNTQWQQQITDAILGEVRGDGVFIWNGDMQVGGNITITGSTQVGTAYASGATTATGTIDIKDSTGTTYHVLVHN